MAKLVSGLVVLFQIAAHARADGGTWRYIPDVTADCPIRPVFRSVAASTNKPDDLVEDVSYRGREQKYVQIRYGSDDSRRVIVVIDLVSRDDFDLYVDGNRNRIIERNDKLTDTGNERTFPLDVETTRGLETTHERRLVRWRLGATQKTIGMATLGYVEGPVCIAGQHYTARRVDGDGNGFFADAADRLWLDLNRDSQWDPLSEQFPFTPVLALNNHRYSVRADAAGSRLALEQLTSEGRIRLRLPTLAKDAVLVKLDVMLTGEDGSAFSLGAADTPAVVPAGRYAIGSVSLTTQPPGSGLPIHFLFSRVGVDASTRWYDLKKDQELALDPVGALSFGLSLDRSQRVCRPGETVRVQPQLFTADGLLINACSVGDAESESRDGSQKHATVILGDGQGRVLERHVSGFV